MTIDGAAGPHPGPPPLSREREQAGANLARVAAFAGNHVLPVATVLLIGVVLWYLAAIWFNAPRVIEQLERASPEWTVGELVDGAWSMERPVVPTPGQILTDFWNTTTGVKLFRNGSCNNRNLLCHAWITASATVLGFLVGTLLGIALAVCILHVRTLDRSLMPWIIVSQTVPILAVAPMIILILNALDFPQLAAKATISAYLSFFPVTIGMVKGLRSPEVLQLDLMHTYNANRNQLLWKLRWPASLPFLFASLKVSVAISLVGAIVGELPTGATAGLGARMLTGSYYGQTIQIWSALLMAALLGMVLVYGLAGIERLAVRHMGGRA
jgi:NitT/TauT family transport system permease protein